MHILFLSDNFYPEVNAPASRTYDHCREWVQLGHQVTVITSCPNFPKGVVYEGYRNKFLDIEFVSGVRVIRVWTFIAPNSGRVLRVFDFLSFMVMGFLAGLFVKKVNIIIGTSPQFFTVCATSFLSKLKRIPWVFELRDFWPESIIDVGALDASWITSLLSKVELRLYKDANHIIAVTKSFKNVLVQRGIESSKISVITNGVSLDLASLQSSLEEDEAKSAEYENHFVIGYFGTLGMSHHLQTVIDSAKKLSELSVNVVFLFIGEGAEKLALQRRAENYGLTNCVFLDLMSKEDLLPYWRTIDVSITHLRKTENFKNVIPSKVFESIGMGTPILHGVAGESQQIVEELEVGLFFEPENVEDLTAKIVTLHGDPSLLSILQKNCADNAGVFCRRKLALTMLEKLENVS